MNASQRTLAGGLLALTLALVTAGLVTRVAAAQGADCPLNEVALRGSAALYPKAALDTSFTTYGGTYRASYDVVRGTLFVYKPVSNFGGVHVRTHDLYDIQGLPPGTVVPLAACLDVNGYVLGLGCGGTGCAEYLYAWVIEGTVKVEASTFVRYEGRSDLITTVKKAVSITVGQPLELDFELVLSVGAGGDNYGGQASGQIRFEGLPEGAHVVSCWGYSTAPVPALPTSWGRIKALYR